MKNLIQIKIRLFFIAALCLIHLQFVQSSITETINNLGKGIIYLTDNRIIKNIRIKEIKPFWIIYEKDGNLHDKMMDEIIRIEFPNVKPEPVFMCFENNEPVLRKMISK